jgi:hypothetical protein
MCPEFTAREGGSTSTNNKPWLGPNFWMDIGSLNFEEEDYKEIILAGFSIMELTTTMKENWIKEIENDQKYQEILNQVKTGKQNVDERIKLYENGMLNRKGRLYVAKTIQE